MSLWNNLERVLMKRLMRKRRNKSPKSVKLHQFIQSSVVTIIYQHVNTSRHEKKENFKSSQNVSYTFYKQRNQALSCIISYTILPFELFSSRNCCPRPHASKEARARVKLGRVEWWEFPAHPIIPRVLFSRALKTKILRRLWIRLSDFLVSLIISISFSETQVKQMRKLTTVQNTLKHQSSKLFESQWKLHSCEFTGNQKPEFKFWSILCNFRWRLPRV